MRSAKATGPHPLRKQRPFERLTEVITTKAFCSALKFAVHAAAVKDVRYYLNGVQFEFNFDQLILVGCDGARMATVSITCASAIESTFIVGNDSVKDILSLFSKDKAGEISFSESDKKLTLTGSSGRVYSPPLVDGKYPDWRRILPPSSRSPGGMPQINPLLLSDACKAIAPLCGTFKDTPSIVTSAAGENNVVEIRPLLVAEPVHTQVIALIQPTRPLA